MKTVKLIITSILIIIAMTVSGDLFQDYLRHFEYAFDSTSLNLPFKVNGEEMTKDILEAGKRHNIGFFTVMRSANGIAQENICVYYSDKSLLDNIKSKCGVEIKNYNSVFFGKSVITAKPFENSTDELLTGTYYLFGERTDEAAFKTDLIEKYGGGLINDGYEPNDDRMFIIMIWAAVAVVFLLLTIFEYSLALKANAVMLSMGANPSKRFVENILIDISVLAAAYLAARLIMSHFTNISFCQMYQLSALLCLIVIDCAVYAKLFRINFGQTFKGNKQQKGMLVGCYVAKYAVSVLAMALVAANIIVIIEAISYQSQSEYWDKYASYNSLKARYVNSEDEYYINDDLTKEISYKAYSEKFNDADIILMSCFAERDFFGQYVIAYNKNSTDYLAEELDGIDFGALEDNKVYAFVPNKIYDGNFGKSNSKVLNEITNKFIDWDGSYDDGAQIMYYDGKAKLISLDGRSDFNSRYYENPVVIFINIDEKLYPRVNTGDLNLASDTYFKMYDMSKKEYKDFFEENSLDNYDVQCFNFNIGDRYHYNLGVMQKSLYICCILTALFLVLNMLITFVTVRIDFSVNAVELALKKVMGYSLFARQRKLFIGSGIAALLSTAAAVIFNQVMELSALPYVFIAGFVFSAADIFVTLLVVRKTEREQISKILKGGAL